VLLALAVVAALTAAAGCGGTDSSGSSAKPAAQTTPRRDRYTVARGLFNEICAGCHTLADAGAHGRRFNLDRDSPLATFLTTEAKRRALARYAILRGEDGMPAWSGVLSQRELRQLIAYVVAVVRDEHARAIQ
jgi:mono/diheme cytochrome c family protein